MSQPTGEPVNRRGPALTAAERAALFAAIDRHPHPRPSPHESARRHRACPDCGSPVVWRPSPRGPGGADHCPNCGREEAPF